MKKFALLILLIKLSLAEENTEKANALEKLLDTPKNIESLEKSIADAKKHGVSEQVILEAKFLFYVDQKNDAAIAAMVPAMEKQLATFKLKDSEIFTVKEEFESVIEFAKALAALQKNDKAEFKKCITEAFWLSPSNASAFVPYINKLRSEEFIASTTVDLSLKIRDMDSEKEKSLLEFITDKNFLVLYFWSPWSPETTADHEIIEKQIKTWDTKKHTFVSVLLDNNKDIIADAKALLNDSGNKLSGEKYADSSSSSLAKKLHVIDTPIIIVLDKNGKIHFHGKVGDEKLDQLLK